LLVSLSSASLNFSAWPLFMDAFSRFISSVGVSPLMKPDDSSRRMGNLPRRTSMSASVRMACGVPLLLGSGSGRFSGCGDSGMYPSSSSDSGGDPKIFALARCLLFCRKSLSLTFSIFLRKF
jgi:hypothetical protein